MTSIHWKSILELHIFHSVEVKLIAHYFVKKIPLDLIENFYVLHNTIMPYNCSFIASIMVSFNLFIS